MERSGNTRAVVGQSSWLFPERGDSSPADRQNQSTQRQSALVLRIHKHHPGSLRKPSVYIVERSIENFVHCWFEFNVVEFEGFFPLNGAMLL